MGVLTTMHRIISRRTTNRHCRTNTTETIKLDMSQVEYVDYTALGLLLALKEKAEAVNVEVVFGPCSKMAMKIFEATSFLKIFRFLPG